MGFDIDGGVFPSFVLRAAHGTNPVAGLGGKGFIDGPAHGADLGGGDEAPYLQKLLALPDEDLEKVVVFLDWIRK